MEDDFFRGETTFSEEDKELLDEDLLDSLDPWEIAFEEGVKQAQINTNEDLDEDDIE